MLVKSKYCVFNYFGDAKFKLSQVFGNGFRKLELADIAYNSDKTVSRFMSLDHAPKTNDIETIYWNFAKDYDVNISRQ